MPVIYKEVEKTKKKRKKSKLSKEEKVRREVLFQRHKTLLLIVYKIGNKVMLEPQLLNICKRLRLTDYTYTDSTLRDILLEMSNLQMITLEKWQTNKRCNMIILNDPCLSWCAEYFDKLLGYKHSVSKESNEGRFHASLVRAEYVLNMLHPNVARSKNLYNTENFFKYIDNEFSLYYSRGRGEYYLEKILSKYKNQMKLSEKEYSHIRYYSMRDFNDLVSRNVNASVISVSESKLVGGQYDVPIISQAITVRIDVFDVQGKVNIDSLLTSASKTIYCFNAFNKKAEFRESKKCNRCNNYKDCIRIIDSEKGFYQKFYTNCPESLYVLDRDVEYKINIYAFDEKGLIKLKSTLNNEKKTSSGELTGASVLEVGLSKVAKIDINKIKVELKSFDFDLKYKKGKRGEKFKEINEARKLANIPEATIKEATGNSVDKELKELVSTIYSLPDDTRAATISVFKNSLESSLKELHNNVNDNLDNAKKEG